MAIKKIVLIVLIIGVTALGAYFALRTRQAPQTAPVFTGFLPFEGAGQTPSDSGGQTPGAGGALPEGIAGEEAATSTVPGLAPKLRRLSDTAQAGGVLFTRNAQLYVRYIEKETGHVYETDLFGNRTRLTNTTVPKIQSAYWNADGSRLIIRYLRGKGNEVVNLQAEVALREDTAAEASQESRNGISGPLFRLEAVRLPGDIREIAVSPDRKRVFYLNDLTDAIDSSGSSSGIVTDFTGARQSEIFTSPHQEWNAVWIDANTISLLSRPASADSGALVSLDAKTGDTRVLLDTIPGLTALVSPDRARILHSESTATSLRTMLLVTETGNTGAFPVRTFPEKCAFTSSVGLVCAAPRTIPAARYPESWYLGAVTFADDIWTIDLETGIANLVPIDGENREPFDAINLSYEPETRTLLFTNKRDGTLWVVIL